MKDFAILNASNPVNLKLESDEYVDYRDGVQSCFDGNKRLKHCTSWHSLTAACETEFFVYGKPGWQGVYKYKNVLVLINRDLIKAMQIVAKLKKAGKKVAVGFHEGVQDFLSRAQDLSFVPQFQSVVNEADFYWNLFPTYHNFFEELLGTKVYSCLHGAPYFEWDHKFTAPWKDREGILVGTRTLGQRLCRNTLISLSIAQKAARDMGTGVTYLDEDGLPGGYLNSIGFNNVSVIQGPLKYEDWLQLIARHRVVYHHDLSMNFGQIATDCALVEVPCVGSFTETVKVAGTEFQNFGLDQFNLEDMLQDPEMSEYVTQSLKDETSFKRLREDIKEAFSD